MANPLPATNFLFMMLYLIALVDLDGKDVCEQKQRDQTGEKRTMSAQVDKRLSESSRNG